MLGESGCPVCPACGARMAGGGGEGGGARPATCPACGARLPGGAASEADLTGFLARGAGTQLGVDAGEGGTPSRLGPYEVTRLVGCGGMGAVYEALDTRLGRRVALKVIRAGEGASPEEIRRFRLEAESAAKLRHPNIVPIHDFGRAGDVDYFTMDFIEGEQLDAWLRRRSRTFRARAEMMAKVARAAHHAHSAGIIHRDMKPGNVMVDAEDEPHVMDFGLARNVEAESSVTVSGTAIGTPSYMPPEQAEGRVRDIDARSDVWSLGAVLYELVTGRSPFTAGSALAVMRAVVYDEPVRPRRIDRAVPKDLETVTLKCLEKDPARRYPSAAALADDLARYLAGDPILARPQTLRYRFGKKLRKHRLVSTLVTALLLLLLGSGGWLVRDWYRQQGDWMPVFERDFTRSPGTEGLEFLDKRLSGPADPWKVTSEGLDVCQWSWCWLKDIRVRGDFRIVVRGKLRDIEVCVGSRLQPVLRPSIVPPGYLFKFGAWDGRLDIISRIEEAETADVSNSVTSAFRRGAIQTVVFQRREGRLSIIADGREVLRYVDPLPLHGAGMDRIGLRSWACGNRIVSLAAYRLSLPEKASPLVAGDSLVETGHWREAVAKYRTIAEDYEGTPVGELALVRAYVAALRLPEEEAGAGLLKKVWQEIVERYPRSPYRARLLEMSAMAAWADRRREDALRFLPEIFGLDPDTRIALLLLGGKRDALPGAVGRELLSWIARTRNADCLSVNGLGLGDLSPIGDMKLTWLMCEGNELTSLRPLQGMPLTFLRCGNNRLTSLEGLEGMPLTVLGCDGNSLTGLDAIRGAPLEMLHCNSNRITSLEPLRGLTTLDALRCHRNRITSLEPLRGMRTLRRLECAKNRIASLEPLSGLTGLTGLGCADNRIASLEPLRGLTALTLLSFQRNQVGTLDPLRGLTALAELRCSGNLITSLEPLRGLTALVELRCSGNLITSLEPLRDLAALAELRCNGNRIESLEPLRGLAGLRRLPCNNNRITSLEPFVTGRKPPEHFLFDCETLPDAELARAREAWSKDQALAARVRDISVILALRKRDTSALRGLAREFRGHRYLHVPRALGWDEAGEFSHGLGGHLGTIGDEEENQFVRSLLASWAWLGATESSTEGEWRWTTDEPWSLAKWTLGQPDDFSPGEDCLVILDDGRWDDRDGDDLLPFIIEWDE